MTKVHPIPVNELKRLRVRLSQMDTLALARQLRRIEPTKRSTSFRLLPKDKALEVFQLLDPVHQEELLEGLLTEQVIQLVEQMEPDDRARLFDEMPATVVKKLLAGLSTRERQYTALLLGYPEESAGRIMSPEFVKLSADMTVTKALIKVRRQGRFAETIYTLPVTDSEAHLLGVVSLKDLILAKPGQLVDSLMKKDVHSVRAEEDQELVARLLQEANVLAVPVLDSEDRLVGLVTVDDAMDVLTLEEEEDIARTGAAEPLRQPYFSVTVFRLARTRIVWLLALILASTLTVNVLSAFEQTLERVVSLALFIPLLIGTGGNTGAQSSTTIVRSMAMGDVEKKDCLRTVFREGGVGFLLGAMLAGLSFMPVWLYIGPSLAAVISLALLTICTLASVVGSMMPILAHRMGVDPAVMSAPLVTTIVDASGLLVYFLIARAVLQL